MRLKNKITIDNLSTLIYLLNIYAAINNVTKIARKVSTNFDIYNK